MQFYKKYAPNFVTTIVQKTLAPALKQSLPLKDQFLRVGTYCKVGFHRGSIVLTGLYRLNIEDVQKLEVAEDISVPPESLIVPNPDDAAAPMPSVFP